MTYEPGMGKALVDSLVKAGLEATEETLVDLLRPFAAEAWDVYGALILGANLNYRMADEAEANGWADREERKRLGRIFSRAAEVLQEHFGDDMAEDLESYHDETHSYDDDPDDEWSDDE